MPPCQVFLFKFYHQGSGRRDEWLLLERRHARSPLHGRIFFRRTRTNRRAWGLWSMTTSGQILLMDFACASDAGIRRWDLCFRPAGCIQQELPDMLGGRARTTTLSTPMSDTFGYCSSSAPYDRSACAPEPVGCGRGGGGHGRRNGTSCETTDHVILPETGSSQTWNSTGACRARQTWLPRVVASQGSVCAQNSGSVLKTLLAKARLGRLDGVGDSEWQWL